MKCEDRPTIADDIPDDEWKKGVPNSFDEITSQTSLIVRLAMVNGYQESEGIPYEECLSRAGLTEFLCPDCHRIHWEIAVPEPNQVKH